MKPVKGVSIYLDMYTAGTKRESLEKILASCRKEGITVRRKDVDNYWRGVNARSKDDIILRIGGQGASAPLSQFFRGSLGSYPSLPRMWLQSPVRFFPCRENGHQPREGWKWGEQLVNADLAKQLSPNGFIGENLIGQPFIVIDIDGDHDKDDDGRPIIDHEVVEEFEGWKDLTESWEARPTSFHLVFWTDKIIPTMHFPYAHVDILGNARNQARYFKHKQKSGKRAWLNDKFWFQLVKFIEMRKERYEQDKLVRHGSALP